MSIRRCLKLDHLYRNSLDADPPDFTTPRGGFLAPVPRELKSRTYPEHMKEKADESNARRSARAALDEPTLGDFLGDYLGDFLGDYSGGFVGDFLGDFLSAPIKPNKSP